LIDTKQDAWNRWNITEFVDLGKLEYFLKIYEYGRIHRTHGINGISQNLQNWANCGNVIGNYGIHKYILRVAIL